MVFFFVKVFINVLYGIIKIRFIKGKSKNSKNGIDKKNIFFIFIYIFLGLFKKV